ncbi:hypothetical protein ROZALSC1DRAFT_29915 [Rozella allomycis CSF55]|uniref:Origin recognition complex subunit 3 winged helix C-terminal domain-containing protein n=1 Tax=Rozella allomycis (strain CSF55) TaxID=988480 RepID=A0A075ASB4_ROZAC|nr:hypothetical protein O9G_000054 [Rozella allomycis CSF55]RKP18395.1 hypothetical protein ROZALSC1DRAFT_29915 [Rozella allomycis CSF55]|eukprot:EPZ31576.1 hypothetical protein O9G_000054 [Rozella allomycis CSF55]
MINLYDWFVSFGLILESGSKEELDQSIVLARFMRSISELQFMGFIKPTARKADHNKKVKE